MMTYFCYLKYLRAILTSYFLRWQTIIQIYANNMGQSSLSGDQQLDFDPTQWIQAVQDASTIRFPNVNPFRHKLFMNKATFQLIQEYQVQFMNQTDFNGFLSELQLRKQQRTGQKLTLHRSQQDPMKYSPYIFKVKHFRNISVQEICTTIYNGLLYIDKVDVRLKEVNDIPFQDYLYLYKACLAGFKILHERVGVFEITEEMIFFDQQGRAKVWMNPNLSKFQPNYEPQFYNNVNYIQTQGSQSQMIRNLINIIESNTDTQSFSIIPSFRDYLKDNCIIDRLSFSKTCEYFQNYLQEYKINPGTYMHSIYELFHYGEKSLKESRQSSEVNIVHFRRKNTEESSAIKKISRNMQKRNKNGDFSFKKSQFTDLDQSVASKKSQESELYKFGYVNNTQVNNRLMNPPIQSKSYTQAIPNKGLTRNGPLNLIKRSNPATNFILNRETNGRSALTFNPEQFKQRQNPINFQHNSRLQGPAPTIQRYSSLDRFQNFNFGSNSKTITFSYQKQGTAAKIKMNQLKSPQKPTNMTSTGRQSIIDKLAFTPISGNTQKSIESSSTLKPSNKIEEQTDSLSSKKMNYYTSESQYHLDQEIAEDMVKYLSYNPYKS